nr:RNA polymerase sigma factor [Microbacterium ulmi]
MHDGFDAFFRAHYAAVWRYVDRRLGSASADDVAASTFELAYRRLDPAHPHPVGWLFRTASNLMKAEMRRSDRERRAAREAEVLRAPSEGDPELETLTTLLERLPAPHRTVLQLTYWDGLSAADVGVVLGCSEQAVWKRVSRAKAALRAAWPTSPATTWKEAMTNA